MPRPVYRGYGPESRNKQQLINARSETVAPSCLLTAGSNGRKRTVINSRFLSATKERSRFPLPPSVNSRTGDYDKEEVVIVTSASKPGVIGIHDRRPLVITPDADRISVTHQMINRRVFRLLQAAFRVLARSD